MQIETIKVKNPAEPGGYMIINKAEFDPARFEAFEEADFVVGNGVVADRTRTGLDAALSQLPGENTDADYVVNGMRSFFGDVFTAEDEALVRDRVRGANDKGLTVAELKKLLDDKSITYKASATKAELQKLLDDASAPPA